MNQPKSAKPEDMTEVNALGPVPRLNAGKRKKVRYIGEDRTMLFPWEIYTATTLEDGTLLVENLNGTVGKFDADQFETTYEEETNTTYVSFVEYINCIETKRLARVKTPEYDIPVNVSLEESSDPDLCEGQHCTVQLWSNEYSISIYSSVEEYRKDGTGWAPISLVPSGTFPADLKRKDFKQNATIVFTGIVREAERTPLTEEDAPTWRLRIETLGFMFDLYYYGDKILEPGFVVDGVVWLYGTLKRADADD